MLQKKLMQIACKLYKLHSCKLHACKLNLHDLSNLHYNLMLQCSCKHMQITNGGGPPISRFTSTYVCKSFLYHGWGICFKRTHATSSYPACATTNVSTPHELLECVESHLTFLGSRTSHVSWVRKYLKPSAL
jgi:hypothetical protein